MTSHNHLLIISQQKNIIQLDLLNMKCTLIKSFSFLGKFSSATIISNNFLVDYLVIAYSLPTKIYSIQIYNAFTFQPISEINLPCTLR